MLLLSELTTQLLLRYPSEERDILDGLQPFDQQGLRMETESRLKKHYPQIQQALHVLGDRDSVQRPVSTPLAEGQQFPCEDESFRWFVVNDKGRRQGEIRILPQKQVLAPLSGGGTVPVLKQNPWLTNPPDTP